MESINRELLKRSFFSLANKSIELLVPYFAEYIPPYKDKTYDRFFKMRSLHEEKQFSSHFFTNLICEKRFLIETSEEFRKFVHIIQSDERTARNVGQQIFLWGGNFGNAIDHFYWILQKIVKEYYEKNSFETILPTEYKKFEDFLCNDDIEISVLAPIFNLKLDYGSTLELESILNVKGKAVLRQIEESEKYRMMFHMDTPTDAHITISKSNLVLELKYREPKFIGEPGNTNKRSQIESKLQNFITALRLLNNEFVGSGVTAFKANIGESRSANMFRYNVKDFFPPKPKILYKSDGTVTFEEIPAYTLGQRDLHDLVEIFTSFRYRKSNSNIELALNRYEESYQNESLENKFIDLSISLEALFSVDEDIHGSLAHKYSLRLSTFIEQKEKDRGIVYRRMSKLYGQRSSILHPKKKKTELQINLLREFVRKSIKEYLSRLKKNPSLSHESIVADIDFA